MRASQALSLTFNFNLSPSTFKGALRPRAVCVESQTGRQVEVIKKSAAVFQINYAKLRSPHFLRATTLGDS